MRRIVIVSLLVSAGFVFAQQGEPDLKEPVKEGQDNKQPVGEVIIDFKQDGTVVINQRAVNAEELKETLSRMAKLDPDQAVVLRGDQNVNYKHIVDALEICRAANIWNVAFAERKPE